MLKFYLRKQIGTLVWSLLVLCQWKEILNILTVNVWEKPDRWHTWPIGHCLRLAVGTHFCYKAIQYWNHAQLIIPCRGHSSPSLVNGWLRLEIEDHDFSCMSKYEHILSGFLRHLQLKCSEINFLSLPFREFNVARKREQVIIFQRPSAPH